jgi:hypothetical protein
MTYEVLTKLKTSTVVASNLRIEGSENKVNMFVLNVGNHTQYCTALQSKSHNYKRL